jgi:hypothetical protein
METKKAKTSEPDEVLQWLKNSRARFLRLPFDTPDYTSRQDVLEMIAKNRTITALDVSECEVR